MDRMAQRKHLRVKEQLVSATSRDKASDRAAK